MVPLQSHKHSVGCFNDPGTNPVSTRGPSHCDTQLPPRPFPKILLGMRQYHYIWELLDQRHFCSCDKNPHWRTMKETLWTCISEQSSRSSEVQDGGKSRRELLVVHLALTLHFVVLQLLKRPNCSLFIELGFICSREARHGGWNIRVGTHLLSILHFRSFCCCLVIDNSITYPDSYNISNASRQCVWTMQGTASHILHPTTHPGASQNLPRVKNKWCLVILSWKVVVKSKVHVNSANLH